MSIVLSPRQCDAVVGRTLAFDPAQREARLRPAHAFSTASVEPARQFEAWQAQCGALMELSALFSHHAGYQAQCTVWKLGPFALSGATAQAARYRRSLAQIRRDAIDHWVIRIARRGMHRMWTATDLAVAPTGLPVLFSLGNAFQGERSDLEWVSLIVPRDLFPGLAPVIDRSLYAPLGSSMGLLLGRYLDALEMQLGDMTEAELPRLVAATRAMVAACIVPSAQARETAAPLLEHARLERIRLVIRQNLRSPTLTPKRICRLVGMSRSQLYRLFEPMGGVARYIQTERLREAHRALADAGNLRDIREVAEDLGFFDASAFSRTFRREYGCTPSEVRVAAVSGSGEIPLRRPSAQAASGTLTSVLQMLR